MTFEKKIGQRYKMIVDHIAFDKDEIITLIDIHFGNFSLYRNDNGNDNFLCDIDHGTPEVEFVSNPKPNMNELTELVEQWFVDRGLDKAEPSKQMLKLFEELGELSSGMARHDTDLIKDSIGDVLVVLIGLSMQMNIDITECLNLAYDEIKDRKGKLIDGIWVKEADLLKMEKED